MPRYTLHWVEPPVTLMSAHPTPCVVCVWPMQLSMSMLEIYNETIGDMLNRDDAKLAVREHPKEGVHVPGLTINTVSSAEAVVEIMGTGYRNRTTFATDMNEHSSRSHWYVLVDMTTAFCE